LNPKIKSSELSTILEHGLLTMPTNEKKKWLTIVVTIVVNYSSRNLQEELR